MQKKKILLGYFFILFLSVAKLAIATEIKPIKRIDEANERAILKYVNEYRIQHGLNSLKLSKLISVEAEKHSQDMAKHAIPFGHQYFNQRIKRIFAQIKGAQAGAENVAYNYKDGKTVVRNWLTSPGHRRNIEGHYHLTGIGLARDKKGKIYFTQIFVRTNEARKKPVRNVHLP